MMKRFFILCTLLAAFSFGSQAQNSSVRLIKIGNTYRETNQYKEAERALQTGLSSVRLMREYYWQAVAYENLGLLYRDMEDSTRALRYVDSAFKLFQQLNMQGSRMAMLQMGESLRKKAEAFAGIDIGSTGIKLSIVQVTLGREGRYIYNTSRDSAINSNFADLNSTAFESGKKAIRSYFNTINKLGIAPDHVYAAFSSGVLQAAVSRKMSQDSIAQVMQEAAKSVMPSYSRPIEFLTGDLEAKYTNMGVVLPKFKEKSVSIDIGGGNTKGGYYNTDGSFEAFALPFGSRFMNLTPAGTALQESTLAELKYFNQTPGIQNKKEVFFLGGIVWAMVNLLFPERANADYVEFSSSDVENFQKMSGDYSSLVSFTNERIAKIAEPETAAKAQTNLQNTQSTFTAENLKRGALLLSGIMDQLQTPTIKKRYYFLSKGSHIAWVTGYVVYNITEKYRTATE